jgi:hypothetical protein
MQWSDIVEWKESTLETEYGELDGLVKRAETWGQEILKLNQWDDWQGQARDAADQQVDQIANEANQILVELREMKRVTSQMQQRMGEVEGLVNDATAHASNSGFIIHSDGAVEDTGERTEEAKFADILSSLVNIFNPFEPNVATKGDHTYARQEAVNACAKLVEKAVRRATEADQEYAAALRAIEQGTITPAGSLQNTLNGPLPRPADLSDTRAVSQWWDSLSREEQEELVAKEPKLIGNLNGVDAWARDKANRAVMQADYDDLKSREGQNKTIVEAYEKSVYDSASGISPDEYQKAKEECNRLEELEKLKEALNQAAGYNGKSQLLVYDVIEHGPTQGYSEDQYQLHAAISVGDVDTADNVAVHVGGLSSNVKDNVVGYTAEMANVAAAAGGNTASVTWFGYDPPQMNLSPLNGIDTVTHTDLAAKGGKALAGFLEGLHDARQGAGESSDVRITGLGHSYGSTTLGYGLSQVRDDVVDSAVFYASPGVPADDVSDFNVPSDSVYAMRNNNDIIGCVPNIGPVNFAPDADMAQMGEPIGLSGVQTIEGKNDPSVLNPLTSHSDYFDSTNYQSEESMKDVLDCLRKQGLPETEESIQAEILRRQQANATDPQRTVGEIINGSK